MSGGRPPSGTATSLLAAPVIGKLSRLTRIPSQWYAYLVADSLEIKYADVWYPKRYPFAVPFLVLDRISKQRQELKALDVLERLEVPELRDVVVREHQGREVRYRQMKGW